MDRDAGSVWIHVDCKRKRLGFSTRGKQIVVADSDHLIMFERPDAIISAVRGMVGARERGPEVGSEGGQSILLAAELALAAIAAALAFLTAMVCATVLGAVHADVGGGLVANAAGESGGFGCHDVLLLGLLFNILI